MFIALPMENVGYQNVIVSREHATLGFDTLGIYLYLSKDCVIFSESLPLINYYIKLILCNIKN